MKFYSDKNKVIMVQSVTSANTFVSSVTGIIKNYILKAFPKDYFRYIYVDTSETFQEHNKTQLYNKDLNKIPYPSLTISPQLSIDDPAGGMKNILYSSPNFWIPKDLNRQYPTLLADPDGKYKIYFSSDYTTFNLRFKIIVDSFIQATNLSYFLKSRFDDNIFKYVSNKLIQAEVPRTFINAIAKIENLFTEDEDDQFTNEEDLETLDELLAGMGTRAKTIIRKTSLNTGKPSYFFEEKSNLLTLFADLDIPEGVIRDNSVNGEYEINFRMQVSAWWPNAYIMAIDRDAYQMVEGSIMRGNTIDTTGNGFYSISISTPLALDRKQSIYFDDSEENTHIGINVLHEVVNYEYPEPISKINIGPWIWDRKKDNDVFNDLKKVHAYCVDNNINLTKLFKIFVRSSSKGEELLGSIDYTTMEVTFSDPIDSDIILDVFINRVMFDKVCTDMAKDTFYATPTSLTTMVIPIYDSTTQSLIEQKVRIYFLKEDETWETTELDKSLRVMTIYGIGYVGLVPEGDARATNLKICMGKNKYNNDIIRCFEKL